MKSSARVVKSQNRTPLKVNYESKQDLSAIGIGD